MNNFPEINNENMGGAASFSFIPTYMVAGITDAPGNVLSSAPTLKAGGAWFSGKATPKSLVFTETIKETDAGDLYEYTVAGNYPGQSAQLAAMFAEMKPQPFLLDVIDNNNQRRLLGSIENPVRFKYSYSSKETPNQRPDYSFTFTFTTSKPAYFYAPQ